MKLSLRRSNYFWIRSDQVHTFVEVLWARYISCNISMANYHVHSVLLLAFERVRHLRSELILLADTLFLVPVPVSLLRESLVAECT